MVIKNITVRNFGAIEFLSYDFSEGINVISNRAADEIALAIKIVLNHKCAFPLPDCTARERAEIMATVAVNQKIYAVRAFWDTENNAFKLAVFDGTDTDVTAEYLYLTSHCEEHDRTDAFDGAENDHRFGLARYVNADRFCSPEEMSPGTDRLLQNKTFRAYVSRFIKNFRPQPIRRGKPYELILNWDGIFEIQNPLDSSRRVLLSESEQKLFSYMCFLQIAEVWRGFEELRNLHGIKKPLIIKNFLERLDASIDTQELTNRTAECGRQSILLTVQSDAYI